MSSQGSHKSHSSHKSRSSKGSHQSVDSDFDPYEEEERLAKEAEEEEERLAEKYRLAEKEHEERSAKRLAEDPKTKEVLDEWISVVSDVFEIPEYGNIKVTSGEFDRDRPGIDSGIFPYVKLIIYILTKKQEECVSFVIKKNFDTGFSIINIHTIDKCNMGGNNILKALEDVAQKLKIKYVMIGQDASHINLKHCNESISLYVLSILSTGESWYNRRGYKQISPDDGRDDEELELDNTSLYDEETAANTKFITETKVRDFLIYCKMSVKFMAILESVVLPFEDKTVRTYFKEIDAGLRNNTFNDCTQQSLIATTIKDIGDSSVDETDTPIKYTNFNLVKKISGQGRRPSHIWDEEGPPSQAYSISLGYSNKMSNNKTRQVKSLSDTHLGRTPPSRGQLEKWHNELARGRKLRVSKKHKPNKKRSMLGFVSKKHKTNKKRSMLGFVSKKHKPNKKRSMLGFVSKKHKPNKKRSMSTSVSKKHKPKRRTKRG